MDKEKSIAKEYDYSNIVPIEQYVAVLIQYCERIYNKYIQLIEEDEIKNEKIKYEYQTYQYGKIYQTNLNISITEKNYQHIECKNYNSFLEAVKNKQVNNISKLEIELNINFKRGTNKDYNNYNNEFKIKFEPYEISFTRKSNFDESEMKIIEDDINEILKKFPAVNTIFCTKNNI